MRDAGEARLYLIDFDLQRKADVVPDQFKLRVRQELVQNFAS